MYQPRTSISFSTRRHFVDNFFFSQADLIKGKVIDIGGKKGNKRGLFNVEKYNSQVTFVNLYKDDNPDIIADARSLPVPDNSFDVAIMGELLEHVPDPKAVLKESYRILKKDGIALITIPFLYPIHADPYDYGRYTESYWQGVSEEIGFTVSSVKRHGGIFAVAALMVQHIFRAKNRSWEPLQTYIVKFFMWLDKKTVAPLLLAWTTGYGIVLRK